MNDEYNVNVTNCELAVWLRSNPRREVSYMSNSVCDVYHDYVYRSDLAHHEVPQNVWVRETADELWSRPTVQYIRESGED